MIGRFVTWIRSFFQKPESKRKQAKRREKEHFGAHFYLGDLLERLDDVFQDLRLFRKLDPDAFKIFNKTGATVSSSDGVMGRDLEPYILESLPAVGCYYIGGAETEEKVPPSFIFFIKEKRPINVQPVNHGDVYRCVVTYKVDGHPVGTQFYVAVSDQNILPLQQCLPREYKTPVRSLRARHNPRQTIVRMEWGFPERLQGLAQENGKTVQEMAKTLFCIAANGTYQRENGLTVTVKKHRYAAAFAIDVLRTPYFFADRDKVVTEDGQTKKILHIVRGHWRTVAGGEKVFIKSHFRGLKEFMWNGYNVRIGMAGRHGAALSSFGIASLEEIDTAGMDTVGADEIGEALEKVLA